MKTLLFAALISLVSAAVPYAMVNSMIHSMASRQATTTTPTSMNNLVPVWSCNCIQTNYENLQCVPSSQDQNLGGGAWQCGCFETFVPASSSCPIYVPPTNAPTTPPGQCPASFFPNFFDVFALGSVSVTNACSLDNRIAAANSIQLNNFTINPMLMGTYNGSFMVNGVPCSSLQDDEYKYAVVCGQALQLTNGKVWSGEVAFGSSQNVQNVTLSQNCNSMQNTSIINFNAWSTYFNELSSAFGALPLTGNTTFSNNLMTLSGSNMTDAIEVFNISANWFSQTTNFEISGISTGVKAIVFNVFNDLVITGTGSPSPLVNSSTVSLRLPPLNLWEMWNQNSWTNKLIWNFGSLSNIVSSNQTQLVGDILAPKASLGGTFARIYGRLFVDNINLQELQVQQMQEAVCFASLVNISWPGM